jgi:NADH:ubiquinone oxidoreductase subunit 3 (subunit A)
MVGLMHFDFVNVARALTVLAVMTLLGLPVTIAWASLRTRGILLPAFVFMGTLVIALMWAGGQL